MQGNIYNNFIIDGWTNEKNRVFFILVDENNIRSLELAWNINIGPRTERRSVGRYASNEVEWRLH